MRLVRYIALVLLVACSDLFEPSAPYHEFVPPPEFRDWWIETETCSQRSGNFERVSWFVFEEYYVTFEGRLINGLWAPPHRIWLVPRILDTLTTSRSQREHTIRSEMLHDLLNTSSHNAAAWTDCKVNGIPLGHAGWGF